MEEERLEPAQRHDSPWRALLQAVHVFLYRHTTTTTTTTPTRRRRPTESDAVAVIHHHNDAEEDPLWQKGEMNPLQLPPAGGEPSSTAPARSQRRCWESSATGDVPSPTFSFLYRRVVEECARVMSRYWDLGAQGSSSHATPQVELKDNFECTASLHPVSVLFLTRFGGFHAVQQREEGAADEEAASWWTASSKACFTPSGGWACTPPGEITAPAFLMVSSDDAVDEGSSGSSGERSTAPRPRAFSGAKEVRRKRGAQADDDDDEEEEQQERLRHLPVWLRLGVLRCVLDVLKESPFPPRRSRIEERDEAERHGHRRKRVRGETDDTGDLPEIGSSHKNPCGVAEEGWREAACVELCVAKGIAGTVEHDEKRWWEAPCQPTTTTTTTRTTTTFHTSDAAPPTNDEDDPLASFASSHRVVGATPTPSFFEANAFGHLPSPLPPPDVRVVLLADQRRRHVVPSTLNPSTPFLCGTNWSRLAQEHFGVAAADGTSLHVLLFSPVPRAEDDAAASECCPDLQKGHPSPTTSLRGVTPECGWDRRLSFTGQQRCSPRTTPTATLLLPCGTRRSPLALLSASLLWLPQRRVALLLLQACWCATDAETRRPQDSGSVEEMRRRTAEEEEAVRSSADALHEGLPPPAHRLHAQALQQRWVRRLLCGPLAAVWVDWPPPPPPPPPPPSSSSSSSSPVAEDPVAVVWSARRPSAGGVRRWRAMPLHQRATRADVEEEEEVVKCHLVVCEGEIVAAATSH